MTWDDWKKLKHLDVPKAVFVDDGFYVVEALTVFTNTGKFLGETVSFLPRTLFLGFYTGYFRV